MGVEYCGSRAYLAAIVVVGQKVPGKRLTDVSGSRKGAKSNNVGVYAAGPGYVVVDGYVGSSGVVEPNGRKTVAGAGAAGDERGVVGEGYQQGEVGSAVGHV